MLPVFVMFDFSSSSTGNRAQRMASDLYAVCNKFGDLGPPCNFSNFQAQLNERRAWSHVGKELVRFLVSAGFRGFVEYRQLFLNFSIFPVKKGLDPRVPNKRCSTLLQKASISFPVFQRFFFGAFFVGCPARLNNPLWPSYLWFPARKSSATKHWIHTVHFKLLYSTEVCWILVSETSKPAFLDNFILMVKTQNETYLQILMAVMRILLFTPMIFVFLLSIFSAGVPLTRQTEETRVWQKKSGQWVNVHLHLSNMTNSPSN